jgi:predicted RecB family nuclease
MVSVKITEEVLTAYLHCKYKAYLLLTGVVQEPSEYEQWLHRHDQEYTAAATRVLLDREEASYLPSHTPLTSAHLTQGLTTILGAHVEDASCAFAFHALQRVPGASSVGPFHYVPVLFCGTGQSVSETQKLLLAGGTLVLERLQHVRPPSGIVLCGDAYKSRRVDLGAQQVKAQKILNDLTDYLQGHKKPRLWLNDHCRVCRYQQQCRAEATQLDDLSLLHRMSEREMQLYHRKGIFTVRQLSYTFRFRKRGKRVKARGRPHSFPLQALAIREHSVFVVSKPAVPEAATHIYVDMEGSPSGSFVYLIGVLIAENGSTRHHAFWADSREDEAHLFRQFLQCLSHCSNAHLFYYGSYEAQVFRRILASVSLDKISEVLLTSATNVLSLLYASIYFPTYSNELKAIGKYLGCEWSAPDATGLHTLVWRAQWEHAHDPALKDRLILYNQQDCLALQKVREVLATLPADGATRDTNEGGIRFVEQITIEDDRPAFGKNRFAVEDFSLINKRAYFDYQRDKIYVSTNHHFKDVERRKQKNKKRYSLRPNQVVTLRAVKCPYCQRSNIARDYTNFHARDSLDLRISPGGIKRWIIRYLVPFHRCRDCDRTFVPQTWRNQRRFGHSLIAWAIDQHVTNRITFQNLERTAKDYFGLPIRFSKLHDFKAYAAQYYTITYDTILKKLVNGAIIHADETKINLQKGSGYVWVLTSMEEVVYLYRPGREADFLHKTLNGFKGVLITDFYTGYDSLPCLQQKCLIHLIRDINDDLLKHPFDQELKELATLFGQLLRGIIATVDRVGLRTSYLSKHMPEVKEFMDVLTVKAFESGIAGQYCKRILKYQSKLFTFLDHDGVPWNNNNAEHAVKYFAKYRRLTNGRVTESGLQNYLVLLSVYQTCRYKEIRFLDFLLSKARDIDRFVAINQSIKTRRRMNQEPLPHSMLRMGQPSAEEWGDGGLATLGEHQR